MGDKRQALLDALKLELEFVERGGYEPSVHEPHKEMATFQNSPSYSTGPVLGEPLSAWLNAAPLIAARLGAEG